MLLDASETAELIKNSMWLLRIIFDVDPISSVFLLSGYDIITYPGLAISFIAELSLVLWLLIMGVKKPL